MFIAREEKSAVTRVRVESEESKMAMVAFRGAGGGSCREGEGVCVCSGYDMEGKEEVMDSD